MTRYPYLLFDADNTLFCFDEANAHAFRAVCDAFGLPFSQELFDRYEVINNATWERFDRGELTKDETVLERFRAFFAAEGIRGLDPTACNRVHLASLSNATYLMPHAAEVVAKLREIPGVVFDCPKGAFYLMAALPVDNADTFQRWLLEEFEDNGDTVMFAPGEPFYATPGRGRSEIRIAYVLKQADLERAMDLLALGIRRYNAR